MKISFKGRTQTWYLILTPNSLELLNAIIRKNRQFQLNFCQVGAGKNDSELVVQLGKEDKPRGIDLDVCEGRVYWTNWNRRHPAIQRAYYSGYDRQDLITENVHMPNGLALDLKASRLYWADARLDKIEVGLVHFKKILTG